MRDDLVGEYIGQTAPKTKYVLSKAMGGVLFIDEAYSLFRDDDARDYGQECVDILMQVMENQRDQLVVIMAGVQGPDGTFFESNPGMRSRLAHHLDFAAYQADELLAIGELMLGRVVLLPVAGGDGGLPRLPVGADGSSRSSPTPAASATHWSSRGSGMPTASPPSRTGPGARTT